MIFSQSQTFFALVFFCMAIGMVRGWQRELITAGVVLAGLLFVNDGGGTMLANLFTQGAGSVTQPTSTTSYNASASCLQNLPSTLGNITFVGLTFLGYRIGGLFAPAPELAHHRITGLVPGAINGAALAYFASSDVLHGSAVTLGTPNGATAGAYLPLVIGVGLVGTLLVVFITSQAGRSKRSGAH